MKKIALALMVLAVLWFSVPVFGGSCDATIEKATVLGVGEIYRITPGEYGQSVRYAFSLLEARSSAAAIKTDCEVNYEIRERRRVRDLRNAAVELIQQGEVRPEWEMVE